jgi:site-specific DNA-methyltransferase (adenine-specific)
MDPCLGIGTSAIAAHRQGIEAFTGIELDALYFQTARERLEDEIAKFSDELPLK